MVMPGGLKVLIVEDSTLFRQLLRKTLHDRFSSIEIYEVADGEEELKKVERLRPNLIFMDIGLPGENGLELT
jgi:CheY-like chemotaxis protein